MKNSTLPSLASTLCSLALLLTGGVLAPACLSRPVEPIEPNNSSTVNEALTQSRVDKIDILLAIDDSKSMADKQAILAVAVPELVEALVNPPCLAKDNQGGELESQPASPLDDCPEGMRREFEPVLDIHVGIISTSLGSRGTPWASFCEEDDDNAMLLNRLQEPGEMDTYRDLGFLVWQPEAGDAETGLYTNVSALNDDLAAMVRGVGQSGCGYEAQLESWYRFLVDPEPYATAELQGNKVVPLGVDAELLEQRRNFLRPDSLVAIIMLSDENDCSFQVEGWGYYTMGNKPSRGIMTLKARQECAANPNDPCCAPCGHAAESCPTDPTCAPASGVAPGASGEELLVGLTCFDQKRRYGVDMLYPVQRYIDGLTKREIQDREGNLVDNPLLVSQDGLFRGNDRVFLAGIVGVPWQLIARDKADLSKGLQDAAELSDRNTWEVILGDPASTVPAADPHMRESIHPREGLPAPSAAFGSDPINSHEYTVNTAPGSRGDLQYACTFELPEPIECDSGYTNCDCNPGDSQNNPLCQAPDGSYVSRQYRAKAYPSLRQLQVLKGVGDQGVVGSICPNPNDTPTKLDDGYIPAVGAIVERLKQELGDPCLPRSASPNKEGQVACIVLEGRALADGESCSCDHAAGRVNLSANRQPALNHAMEQQVSRDSGLNCFCEIGQLSGEPLQVCQHSIDEQPTHQGAAIDGWCYVDATTVPTIGNEQLVEHCQPTERRTLRFVGQGAPVNDSIVFITCHQSSSS